MTNAMELLKSAATTGTVSVGGDPIAIFNAKIDTQIELAKKAKTEKVNTRSVWFRKDAQGYVVRIGRNAFEIAGSKLFRAADLDKVIEVLTAAKAVIEQDEKLQAVIRKHSTERSARLKAGRKAKAK